MTHHLFSFLQSVRVRNFEKGNREEVYSFSCSLSPSLPLSLSPSLLSPSSQDFSFDRIFSKGSTLQTEVYEYVAKQTVNDVLKGFVCVGKWLCPPCFPFFHLLSLSLSLPLFFLLSFSQLQWNHFCLWSNRSRKDTLHVWAKKWG